MQKATATYVAPFGDSKVVEMGGVTFFDGKSVDLNSHDHSDLIKNLETNQYFDIDVGKDDETPVPAVKKRGRPSSKDIAAAKEAAETAEAEAKTAAEKAKVAKADADAAVKLGTEKSTAESQPEVRANYKAGMTDASAHDFEKDRQNEIARRDAQAQTVS